MAPRLRNALVAILTVLELASAARAAQTSTPVWTEAMLGLDGGIVDQLLIDPTDADHVYVVGERRGIFESRDAGRSWKMLPAPSSARYYGLRIEPQNSHALWVTTNEGASRSQDAGRTWTPADASIPTTAPAWLEFEPRSRGTVRYCVAPAEGLFKSTDSGATWKRVVDESSSDRPDQLVISPADPDRLYGLSLSRVIVSRDGGATWTSAAALPGESSCLAVVADPVHADGVRLATTTGIFTSTDAGAHWKPANSGLTGDGDPGIEVLVPHPASAGVWYTVTSGRECPFVSRDDGASWKPLGADPSKRAAFRKLAIARSNPDRMYGTNVLGVRRSDDGGKTWQTANSGLTLQWTTGLTVDPATPEIVYLASLTGGVFRSRDAGASWSSMDPTGITRPACEVLLLRSEPHQLYVQQVFGGLRSADAGSTWVPLASTHKTGALILDELHPGVLYRVDYHQEKTTRSVSRDHGRSWETWQGKFSIAEALTLGPASGPALDLCDEAELKAFLQAQIAPSIAEPKRGPIGPVTALAFAPSDRRVAYLGWSAGLILRSADGCRTWTARTSLRTVLPASGPPMLSGNNLKALAVDPDDPDRIYAATARGLAFSADGGGTWSFDAAGLTGPRVQRGVNAVTVLPTRPRQILAATVGALYRSILPSR